MPSFVGIGVAQSVISAAAGLLGVLAGGWVTRREQRWEKRNAHIREQLRDFYSPLWAMRKEIQALSNFRVTVSNAANGAWIGLFDGQTDPVVKGNIAREKGPQYDAIIDYHNTQLRDEILPLYRKMLSHFTAKMWLAEVSTQKHYDSLLEFVEVWNRSGTLPPEVIRQLDHDEKKLYPFYEDLHNNFERLRNKLKS